MKYFALNSPKGRKEGEIKELLLFYFFFFFFFNIFGKDTSHISSFSTRKESQIILFVF